MHEDSVTPLKQQIRKRFDGYLPVVVDLETTGVNCLQNGILEIAVAIVDYNHENLLSVQEVDHWHVNPFEGAIIDPEALKINQIDIDHPFRFAKEESIALTEFFDFVAKQVKKFQCRRAVLVGHNAHFDLNFIQAAIARCKIQNSPFHSFTCLDTATLAGLAYGKTVLAKALRVAKIDFDKDKAHSAVYDTEKTAELFCKIVNELKF